MKNLLALLCCVSLLCAQSPTPEQQLLRQKAVSIPIGKIVEAKLTEKKGKVKGQLVSVGENGITIRTADGGTVSERAVPFSEMRQLREKKGSDTALKIFAGVGIALSAIFLISLALISGA